MTNSGKNVLVIGASGVFGKEITKRFIDQGFSVYGSGRNTDAIPNEATKLKLDLEDQSSIDLVVNYLLNENIPLSGIVIASGAVGFGKATETNADDALRLMQINHLAPANLISRLKPLLTEDSFVIGISGVVSERTFPGMAAYTSSKAAFASFLASINTEWRRDKVQVLDAKPGHTETGLASRALFGTAPAFPQGMSTEHVIEVIMASLAEGKGIVGSSEF
jgi:cyclic-di-GMP-binding biofilm dispersal mediator protein